MAAAYAAVVSLMNTIDFLRINHPRLFISSFDSKQIQSLHEYVVFLQQFLEESLQQEEALESQIAAAAHAAEGVIESHAMDQIFDRFREPLDALITFMHQVENILAKSTGESSSSSLLDLQEVIQDMDSVKEKVIEVMKGKEMTAYNMHQPPTNPMPATSSRLSTTGKSTMVGFDDNLIRLMEVLTGHQSIRQIIPVTGMGGIGKTTLTKNVYENLLIVEHFDLRGWVTVSQNYNVIEILKELLSCIKKLEKSQMVQKSEDQLGEELYKFLSGWRYLIVLDDVWSIEIWEKINCFFPKINPGSRIIVTARESSVASHFGSLSFAMNFLDDDQSWILFCKTVFGQENYCPPELVDIGKQIIKRCKGLPLSIVVIGGILRKSNRSQEYWENVAHDINSILLNSGDDESCLNTLFLSYTHLPAHLKPCFLYMGVFREDHEIRVSKLIKLWVAEGFLKPNKSQGLEEVAEGYLNDLVDRNLIFVHRLGLSGKIKSCKIHDLLRDLCLRISQKETLLNSMRVIGSPQGMDWERRIVFLGGILEEDDVDREFLNYLGSESFACDTLCYRYKHEADCLKPIFQQVRHIVDTTYRGFAHFVDLSFISRFCNLQTLVIAGCYEVIKAPPEIWEMRQLRHLQLYKVCLPDPPPTNDHNQQDKVLLNLRTLGQVVNFNLSEEVCRRIPNINKLNMLYDHSNIRYSVESQWCDVSFEIEKIRFMSSLKKLSLNSFGHKWEDLTIIGSLPHLEVLKLINNAATGDEWNPIEGDFPSLKFLKMDHCNLRTWNADNSHFPVLQTLSLYGMYKLEEIPLSFGDISTFQHIHLDDCNYPVIISAIEILEEQASFGNEHIQVRVKSISNFTVNWLKKVVEPETLKSNNFQFELSHVDLPGDESGDQFNLLTFLKNFLCCL